VAHACNPSYSGVRDQEDQGSKPAQANSSQDPISKIPKKRLAVWLKVKGLRSSPSSTHTKKLIIITITTIQVDGVIQAVQHLPCEALSSNPSIDKKKT
jgi:hypothetical protein